jgi:hypothetical protein
MPYLPVRPDLDQLRQQAKDLLRAAKDGDGEALTRIRAVSDRLILKSAQLAIAREYGFASWPKLKTEVERREILNSRDLSRLTKLLAEQPELATGKMRNWRPQAGRHGRVHRDAAVRLAATRSPARAARDRRRRRAIDRRRRSRRGLSR